MPAQICCGGLAANGAPSRSFPQRKRKKYFAVRSFSCRALVNFSLPRADVLYGFLTAIFTQGLPCAKIALKKRQRFGFAARCRQSVLFDVDFVVHQPACAEEKADRDKQFKDNACNTEGELRRLHCLAEGENEAVGSGRDYDRDIVCEHEV